MDALEDLRSILTHRGFTPMKLQCGHGYRDLLRMDQHWERTERGTVAARATIWDRDGEFEGFINVYEIGYRPTSSRRRETIWRNEKRYTTPITGDLKIVTDLMPVLLEEAMEDVRFRCLTDEEQDVELRASLTPEDSAKREANSLRLIPLKSQIAQSRHRVNQLRRKRV